MIQASSYITKHMQRLRLITNKTQHGNPTDYWLSISTTSFSTREQTDCSIRGHWFFTESEHYDLESPSQPYYFPLKVESFKQYALIVHNSPPLQAVTEKSYTPTHALRNHRASRQLQKLLTAPADRSCPNLADAKPSYCSLHRKLSWLSTLPFMFPPS